MLACALLRLRHERFDDGGDDRCAAAAQHKKMMVVVVRGGGGQQQNIILIYTPSMYFCLFSKEFSEGKRKRHEFRQNLSQLAGLWREYQDFNRI